MALVTSSTSRSMACWTLGGRRARFVHVSNMPRGTKRRWPSDDCRGAQEPLKTPTSGQAAAIAVADPRLGDDQAATATPSASAASILRRIWLT